MLTKYEFLQNVQFPTKKGYICFSIEKGEDLKKKNPDLNKNEIIKLLEEEWNKLSEEEKEKFNYSYEYELKKYEEELRLYENRFRSNPPKKPPSGYFRFLSENLGTFKKNHPYLNFKNIIRLVAKEWNQLSDEKKKIFNDAFEKDKKKYEEELRIYQNKAHIDPPQKPFAGYIFFSREDENDLKEMNLESIFKEIIEILTKKWNQLSEDDKKQLNDVFGKYRLKNEFKSYKTKVLSNQPKKPPNGFIRFFCENLEVFKQKNPDLSYKDLMKLLGKEWRQLSENEKKKYTMSQNSMTSNNDQLNFDEKNSATSKGPHPSYIRFSSEIREAFKKKNYDLKDKEIIRSWAEEWNKLSKDEKNLFKDAYEKYKKQYEEEIRNYQIKYGPIKIEENEENKTEFFLF